MMGCVCHRSRREQDEKRLRSAVYGLMPHIARDIEELAGRDFVHLLYIWQPERRRTGNYVPELVALWMKIHPVHLTGKRSPEPSLHLVAGHANLELRITGLEQINVTPGLLQKQPGKIVGVDLARTSKEFGRRELRYIILGSYPAGF